VHTAADRRRADVDVVDVVDVVDGARWMMVETTPLDR